MKNKLKNIVIALILIFIIVILSTIYTNNNSTNSEIDYKYTNINIDSDQLNIFYFNVGQADCTLITINNKNMLIDAGQDSDGEYIVEFLEKVQPKYAIISAGNHKGYNHPSEEVLERLRNFGIKDENIYITKNQGTIWVTSDGNNISIECREDINLDGTSRLSFKNIFYVCSFCLIENKCECKNKKILFF